MIMTSIIGALSDGFFVEETTTVRVMARLNKTMDLLDSIKQ